MEECIIILLLIIMLLICVLALNINYRLDQLFVELYLSSQMKNKRR